MLDGVHCEGSDRIYRVLVDFGISSHYCTPVLLTALPVSQEFFDATVGQGVLHALFEHLEGAGGDIGTGQGRIDDVAGVANRGRQDFGGDTVLTVNG